MVLALRMISGNDPEIFTFLGEEIMAIRQSRAIWEGNLRKGQGTITFGSKGLEVPFSFAGRFEDGSGSNPEELIGGAHAGCFSMALVHALGEENYPPVKVETTAQVHLEKSDGGFTISKIELDTVADVPTIDADTFQSIAQNAKNSCPVSKVLAGADITLQAKLLSSQRA